MSSGRTISTSRREVVCFAVSVAVHLAVLGWGVFTFAIKPRPADSKESMPIDIISATDFSQLTAGARNAPQLEKAKPLADKVGERKQADDPTAKLAPKEVKAATDQQPPPPPTPRPAAAAEKKQSEPKRDLIADAIKKDQVKKSEPKKAEAKALPKKQQQEQPKFDPRKMAELLDKRTPQRVATAGDAVNETVSLGAPSGAAAQLSQSEIDALRARLAQLWNPPAGATNPDELVVTIRMKLKPDGTLAGPPMVLTRGNSPLFMASRDSAARAVLRGQPFDMLRPEHYEQWKDIEITFDPRDMIRG
jgi:colicin import membrane protein